ncbi:MAG: class I SAM-dependent methyltransferase [Acidobacteria bacterium]|nr:class I SAM-dependent methyltransferase [Acidobacteriota bacterium]MBS1865096.1 class I SAM-dependent methyltransferase [Acidobacteriota bacterium]
MSSPPSQPESANRPRHNDKRKIVEHYDFVSPYYQSLWGEHIHHGFWIRGDESKEVAQLQLVEHLATLAKVQIGSAILDIGCGFGGSSIYLAQKYKARAIGITISPVQVEMARKAAGAAQLDAQFHLMDAEALNFQQQFDLLWSVESISHYHDRRGFFTNAVKFLKPGGVFALTDWFKKEGLSAAQERKFIEPIERGMFIELETMDNYESYLVASGLQIVHRQDLSSQCAKSWDLALEVIRKKSFWILAAKMGKDFVANLKAFHSMRAGYASGNFVCGLFTATKPSEAAK